MQVFCHGHVKLLHRWDESGESAPAIRCSWHRKHLSQYEAVSLKLHRCWESSMWKLLLKGRVLISMWKRWSSSGNSLIAFQCQHHPMHMAQSAFWPRDFQQPIKVHHRAGVSQSGTWSHLLWLHEWSHLPYAQTLPYESADICHVCP